MGARLRAPVSQIESYKTAVNTFRLKYGYIPGDMPSATATQFGLFATTGGIANTKGFGDGNKQIQGGSIPDTTQIGEPLIFWRQLSESRMIDGSFGATTSGNALVAATGRMTAATINGTSAGQIFPPAKIGRGNCIFVFADTGRNYFEISGIAYMDNLGDFNGGPLAGLPLMLSPIEAHHIDSKIDDGLPFSGNARALADDLHPNYPADIGGNCVNGASDYDVGATNGNTPNCQLRLRLN